MSDNADVKIHRWMTQSDLNEKLDTAFNAGVAMMQAAVLKILREHGHADTMRMAISTLDLRRPKADGREVRDGTMFRWYTDAEIESIRNQVEERVIETLVRAILAMDSYAYDEITIRAAAQVVHDVLKEKR